MPALRVQIPQVQLWGRAVDWEAMFDDEASTAASVEFLYKAQRVVDAIYQCDPSLVREEAELVKLDGLI